MTKAQHDLQNQRDLLFQLVRTSFKLRYKDSILGVIWVIIKPLLNFTVLYLFFNQMGRGAGIENFPIYLLLGSILYTFFTEGIIFGMNSLLEKASIILKVNFNRQIAVLSSLFLTLINLLINIVVLLIISIFAPIHPTLVSALYFLFICSTLFTFFSAISFFTSIIMIRLRDLQHVTDLALQLGFFATPIFYSPEILPEYAQRVIKYNPLFYVIQAARAALIQGEVVFVPHMILILGVSLVVLSIGMIFFRRNIRKIAEFF